MSNETRRGRGQLRDTSAAQGVYEVDYMVRINVQFLKNIGVPTMKKKTVTADIKSVNGYILKNGIYLLEENDNTMYRLEKSGAAWHVLS